MFASFFFHFKVDNNAFVCIFGFGVGKNGLDPSWKTQQSTFVLHYTANHCSVGFLILSYKVYRFSFFSRGSVFSVLLIKDLAQRNVKKVKNEK